MFHASAKTGPILLIVATLLAVAGAQENYQVSFGSTPYNALGGGRTVIWNGAINPADDQSQSAPIGFTFSYYGTTYTDVIISSNGYITIPGEPGNLLGNTNLPDMAAPNPVLAPWWDDLRVANYGGTVDEVSYDTIGLAPFRVFVAQWTSVSRFGDGAGNYHFVNFQVRLYEFGSWIRFHYGQSGTFGAPATPFSATIGIENDTGECGHEPFSAAPNLELADFPAWDSYIDFEPTEAQNYRFHVANSTYAFLAGDTDIWDGAGGFEYDDEQSDIPIGFTFEYFGVPYTDVRVSTNGYLTFGATTGTDFSNDPIPDGNAPNPVIAPWWDDLKVANYGAADRVSYKQDGFLPGLRRLTVQWSSVSAFGDNAANYNFLNFQVVLYELNDRVQFRYGGTGTVGAASTLSASIGIENQSGLVGVEPYVGSPSLDLAQFPPPGTFITFLPPSPACYTPLLCGDCNDDAFVNILDALTAAQHAVAIVNLTGATFAACNVEGTPGNDLTPGAAVDILDALGIATYNAAIVANLNCSP